MTLPRLSPATVVVHAGRPPHEVDQPLNAPITMASTYVAGGDLEYGRYANPTWSAFEEALGALEGGRALAFSSGLAAVSTVLDLVGQDGLVVAPRHAYLGSIGQLGDLEARGRLRSVLVDIADTDAVIAALDDAAILWIESPTNPALEVADVERLVAAGHEAGARVVVDNTFATPLLQKPLEQGADIVLHSVTKLLAGHSDIVMGALVVRDAQLYDVLKGRRDLVGAIPGTLEAWLALRGLRTLHLRVERSQEQRHRAGPPPRRPPGHRRGALPRLRRGHLRRARRLPRPPTCSPTPRRCGCTPRPSAASSRRSSAAAAGRRRPRPSPTAWSGCPSASRTSTTSGPTSSRLSPGFPDDVRALLDGQTWCLWGEVLPTQRQFHRPAGETDMADLSRSPPWCRGR